MHKKHAAYFSKGGLPINVFRLRCSEQELERRIHERERIAWQKQNELQGMLKAQEEFDRLFPDDKIFQLIDTTNLNEADTAKKIASGVKH